MKLGLSAWDGRAGRDGCDGRAGRAMSYFMCRYPRCSEGRLVGGKFCAKHNKKTPFTTQAEVNAYRRGVRDAHLGSSGAAPEEDRLRNHWPRRDKTLPPEVSDQGSKIAICARATHEVNRAYCISLGDETDYAKELMRDVLNARGV
jgi:hypothetical protein